MHQSKRFGYGLYPVLFLAVLVVPGLRAQTSSSTPPAEQTPAPAQQEENPQQNQIRLAQEAQARIRARRAQRKQKVVEDTYSHKFEAYGGGGYTRFRPGSSLQHINESAWNGGVTDYLWGRLGLTGDLRGYYGNAFITPNPYNIFKPSISEYSFMAGPQYRFVRREHWAIGGQVLVGATKGNFNASSSLVPPGTFVGLWPGGMSVSFAAGVPIDYNIGPGFAVRIQPGYWLTNFGSTTQIKNLGFQSGIVYRFGRQ
jgi:hypothetical protein